ncbi:hypothetical protein CBR55_34145, partial [Bacillus thuringiensis]
TNASLRKGDVPESLTDARANELLSERRAKEAADGGAPAKKTSTKKTAAKKTTAKKTTAKKTTAKKTVRKAPPKTTKNVVKAGAKKKS